MILTALNIHQVRNIVSAELSLHPRCNIVYGANGSGKTSILEAIYLLGSGHSFRTRETTPLINHGQPMLTVFSRTVNGETISIQKLCTGSTQVKLNGQSCSRSSELAHFLPCQLVYQDIFQIIDAGPAVRRTLLDWGMFHVEHSYHALWKNYRRVLKQRNALLRQRASLMDCKPWDHQLVELALALDSMRADYFSEWSRVFQHYLAQLTDTPCTIHYYKGWDRKQSNKPLGALLAEQFTSDVQRQFTHSGAHQADIVFDSVALRAKQVLSRGQQKMILIALKLAQGALLSKPCVYLFDDVAAELDARHLERLVRCLSQIEGQFFLTAIEPGYLTESDLLADAAVFSLHSGAISHVRTKNVTSQVS